MSKVVVITGAGSGLGRALAIYLSQRGDDVVLLGRTLAKIDAVAAEIGSRTLALACDVGEVASVRRAFATIADRYPRIDALINNAGVYAPSLVRDARDEDILQMVSTNLTGAILCSRAAIPLVSAGGQIINISSESVDMPFAHLAIYQATKAGLERFSLSLQAELEEAGIRVTVLRAGQMRGEGAQGIQAPPKVIGAFIDACRLRGLDLPRRPTTDFNSAARIVCTLLDLPPDVHIAGANLHAWKAGD